MLCRGDATGQRTRCQGPHPRECLPNCVREGPILKLRWEVDITEHLCLSPLDGVLGLNAVLSSELMTGNKLSGSRWQGRYLNYTVVDDIPAALLWAARMYAPGRAPYG